MKCQKTEKYLIEYIEKNLDQELRQEIDVHAQDCGQCARLLAQSQLLWNELGLVDALETPDHFFIKIQQKINRKRQASVPWIDRLLQLEKALVPTLATAVLLVGLLIGNFLGSSLYQNVTGSDSAATTYVEYLGLDYWDSSFESDLLSGFNQSLEVLETSAVNQ